MIRIIALQWVNFSTTNTTDYCKVQIALQLRCLSNTFFTNSFRFQRRVRKASANSHYQPYFTRVAAFKSFQVTPVLIGDGETRNFQIRTIEGFFFSRQWNFKLMLQIIRNMRREFFFFLIISPFEISLKLIFSSSNPKLQSYFFFTL